LSGKYIQIYQREGKGMSTEIVAPMPGTIIEILVKEGEEVLEYQEVVILEAMKMENAIPTPEAGKVKEISKSKSTIKCPPIKS
jgi:biotin carboxyl carrier protein